MDDVRAVMDAAGSERAAIMGAPEGGPMALVFAATHPDRTAATVVFGTSASTLRSDDHPWGPTRDDYLQFVRERERVWGTEPDTSSQLDRAALGTDYGENVKRWWPRYLRLSASPAAAATLMRMNMETDVRHVLPNIHVPTLILASEESQSLHQGRYMAERIPGAELVELPGSSMVWFLEPRRVADEAEHFLTGIWERGDWDLFESERVLATILFTDIVGSTAKMAEIGDARWRELLQSHHMLIRRLLVRHRGREHDTAGDGFFASFDGPGRAIRCACAIREAVGELGLEVRAGLHTGECEVLDGKVGGIAVNIGARVAAEAGPGEVLVSSTVKDLVAGSGIEFDNRGSAELKGVRGEWRLFAVKP